MDVASRWIKHHIYFLSFFEQSSISVVDADLGTLIGKMSWMKLIHKHNEANDDSFFFTTLLIFTTKHKEPLTCKKKKKTKSRFPSLKM